MTNKEKLKEVFGLEPYTGQCPFEYPTACLKCPFRGKGRNCEESFWNSEYKEPKGDKK